MAKVSVYSIINYCFFTITGYCFIDVFEFMLPFTEKENITLKVYGSIIVTALASIFWLVRLFDSYHARKREKLREDMRDKILELELKIKEDRAKEEQRIRDLEELFKNDK